jgi:hypothetical protein
MLEFVDSRRNARSPSVASVRNMSQAAAPPRVIEISSAVAYVMIFTF